MGKSQDGRQGVLCVGAFPPPLHGMSHSLQRVSEDLARAAYVKCLSISSGNVRGILYHVVKCTRVGLACLGILLHRRRGFSRLYMPADAGYGAWYTCMIVGVSNLVGYDVFVHHHSFAYLTRRSSSMSYVVWMGGRRTVHILLCKCMQERFQQLYPLAKSSMVVSNAAHLESYLDGVKNERKRGAPLRIGHLSNLTYEKGFREVTEVFETLVADGVNVQLVLAGPTREPRIEKTIVDLRARHGDCLSYLGEVVGEQKREFYETIDVFLFPTKYKNEAQPFVLLEAVSAGVPCISLRRGCIADTLVAAGNTLVEDPTEFVAEAVARIKSWVGNPSSLRTDSEAVKASARRQLWEAQTEYKKLTAAVTGSDQGAEGDESWRKKETVV